MRHFRFSLVVLGLLTLTACSGVKETLGLERSAPDEFRVMTRAPLTVPPDFTLRPPAQGQEAAKENKPQQQAETALLGTAAPSATPIVDNPATAQFLSQAGVSKADPNIRATVDRETAQLTDTNKTLLDRIRQFTPARVVDPNAERARIEKNKAEDKPITTGQTPMIDIKRPGWFSR